MEEIHKKCGYCKEFTMIHSTLCGVCSYLNMHLSSDDSCGAFSYDKTMKDSTKNHEKEFFAQFGENSEMIKEELKNLL